MQHGGLRVEPCFYFVPAFVDGRRAGGAEAFDVDVVAAGGGDCDGVEDFWLRRGVALRWGAFWC